MNARAQGELPQHRRDPATRAASGGVPVFFPGTRTVRRGSASRTGQRRGYHRGPRKLLVLITISVLRRFKAARLRHLPKSGIPGTG
jgi:hypothetical protein